MIMCYLLGVVVNFGVSFVVVFKELKGKVMLFFCIDFLWVNFKFVLVELFLVWLVFKLVLNFFLLWFIFFLLFESWNKLFYMFDFLEKSLLWFKFDVIKFFVLKVLFLGEMSLDIFVYKLKCVVGGEEVVLKLVVRY